MNFWWYFPSRKPFILSLFLFFSFLLTCSANQPSKSKPGPDCPSCIADFALYNPAYEDDGVWEEEVAALKTMFETYGWTYDEVGPQYINNGNLGKGPSRKYRSLIAPGGYAYYRTQAVNARGDQNIRDFIASGGHFIGFCAGAYWPVSRVICSLSATGPGGNYNVPRDYKTYPYDLHLLNADAKGPLGWIAWNKGTIMFDLASINLQNKTMAAIHMPPQTRFINGGGPFFTNFRSTPPGYEVWATAIAPPGTPSIGSTGNAEPTIIRFLYGEGTVILFSYHPDILIHNTADQVQLSMYYNENMITWDTGKQSLDEINLQSWNIVHAALQIGANQEPTPLESLPPQKPLRWLY